MGTHPNGPSHVFGTETTLKSVLNEHNLSRNIVKLYNGDLPFLFKVLSIRKALSIQAHPDKVLASKLFKEFPNVYNDDNHKTEMVIFFEEFFFLYIYPIGYWYYFF